MLRRMVEGRILSPLKGPNPVKESPIASRLYASGEILHLPSPSKRGCGACSE